MQPTKAKLNTTEEERKLRFHDLHRTYTRVLLGGGCDIACMAQQLGHSPAVLLSTYTGVIDANSGTEKGQPEHVSDIPLTRGAFGRLFRALFEAAGQGLEP
jgi:integrase